MKKRIAKVVLCSAAFLMAATSAFAKRGDVICESFEGPKAENFRKICRDADNIVEYLTDENVEFKSVSRIDRGEIDREEVKEYFEKAEKQISDSFKLRNPEANFYTIFDEGRRQGVLVVSHFTKGDRLPPEERRREWKKNNKENNKGVVDALFGFIFGDEEADNDGADDEDSGKYEYFSRRFDEENRYHKKEFEPHMFEHVLYRIEL